LGNGVHWNLGGRCITFDSPKSARIRICYEYERGIQNISVEAE